MIDQDAGSAAIARIRAEASGHDDEVILRMDDLRFLLADRDTLAKQNDALAEQNEEYNEVILRYARAARTVDATTIAQKSAFAGTMLLTTSVGSIIVMCVLTLGGFIK